MEFPEEKFLLMIPGLTVGPTSLSGEEEGRDSEVPHRVHGGECGRAHL